MNSEAARGINMAFGVVLGALILFDMLTGAVYYAPMAGYAVPSSLQWLANLPILDTMWVETGISAVLVAWIVFGLRERAALEGKPSRRRSERGSVAVEIAVLALVLFVAGALLYALFGFTFGALLSDFQHFLGGL